MIDVLAEPPVLVDGDVARGPAGDADLIRIEVENRHAFAVRLPGTLDLVRGGGRAKLKIWREQDVPGRTTPRRQQAASGNDGQEDEDEKCP